MVKKEYIFRFLRDLENNNSKEWMDDHREQYHTMKERWLEEVQHILDRLSKHNPVFETIEPKDTIQRINNNQKFHPEKPTYKNFVSCFPAGRDKPHRSHMYILVGLDHCFIAGGLYRPHRDNLEKLRGAIDYEGENLKKILDDKRLTDFYGGLDTDEQKLKTAPQNYKKDHPHIDLLNRKSLTIKHELTQKEVCSDDFIDLVEEGYLALRPLDEFILKALSV